MLGRQIEVLWSLGGGVLAGTGLVLGGVVLGWIAGRYPFLPPVRLVDWWVQRVVLPLLRTGSWWRRTVAIFSNNTSICAILVLMGASAVTAWLAIACLGLSLGTGLRLLSSRLSGFSFAETPRDRRAAYLTKLGMWLNMLEPPAIAAAIGLSLGQHAMPGGWSMIQTWETFAVCVVPALLVAAGGEALWMGAVIHPESGEPTCDLPEAEQTLPTKETHQMEG